jgi:hypothetical protein
MIKGRIVKLNRVAVKRAVLPSGRKIRRLPLGIARGATMGIDFQRGETGLYFGLYEVELNKHIRRIAQRGYRSFDVGGHFGYDALILAKLTGSSVVTIESDPTCAEELAENASANVGMDIAVEVAIAGSKDGNGHVTVDGLTRKHFVPDLLKIDIEGAEADALRGAERTLAQRKPAVLLEVHGVDMEWECLALMRAAGYAPPTVIEPRRWLPDKRMIEHNRWLVFPG